MDRLKSVFLASMSHELRTPLNSIIGFTGIILQGMSGEVNQEQRKQLTMVKNSASHLLSLINDVLDISKIEAGKVELSPEEFTLDGVVREAVESLSPTANEKGLEVLTEVPEDITLFSDKRRLKQVLMNLVGNAVKFTDRGSVKITARVLKNDNLEISVIDTGVGIKQGDMDKLFQPFQQIDVFLTKNQEGTGLGLHLTKKLADLLGGNISAKSEYGTGSEFTFTMPLRHEEGN
jgi:signal transduction histidine kinase